MRINHIYQGCVDELPQNWNCAKTCNDLEKDPGCGRNMGAIKTKKCIKNLQQSEKKKKVKLYCRQTCEVCGKLIFYI